MPMHGGMHMQPAHGYKQGKHGKQKKYKKIKHKKFKKYKHKKFKLKKLF